LDLLLKVYDYNIKSHFYIFVWPVSGSFHTHLFTCHTHCHQWVALEGNELAQSTLLVWHRSVITCQTLWRCSVLHSVTHNNLVLCG